MALLDILKKIESSKGFKITNVSERANLVKKINTAALELYTKTDLDGSLMEQLFVIDVQSANIVLPPEAGWIRGCRYADARIRVDQSDIRPRYHHGGFHREVWPLKFRELPRRATFLDITNQSVIKLTLPIANGDSFKLVLIGKNSNSQYVKEELDFGAGDTEKETMSEFDEISSIIKDKRTTYDITVADVNDAVLAIFPNYSKELIHLALQISDATEYPYGIFPIEVLFKRHYISMEDDYDTFLCGSQYEDAIYWKFRELYALDKENDYQGAKEMRDKASNLKADIDDQVSMGQTLKINFAANPVFKIFSGLRLRKYVNRQLAK